MVPFELAKYLCEEPALVPSELSKPPRPPGQSKLETAFHELSKRKIGFYYVSSKGGDHHLIKRIYNELYFWDPELDRSCPVDVYKNMEVLFFQISIEAFEVDVIKEAFKKYLVDLTIEELVEKWSDYHVAICQNKVYFRWSAFSDVVCIGHWIKDYLVYLDLNPRSQIQELKKMNKFLI